jgi:hypothetical protein
MQYFPSHLPPVFGEQNHHVLLFQTLDLWRSSSFGSFENQEGISGCVTLVLVFDLSTLTDLSTLQVASCVFFFNFFTSVCNAKIFSSSSEGAFHKPPSLSSLYLLFPNFKLHKRFRGHIFAFFVHFQFSSNVADEYFIACCLVAFE